MARRKIHETAETGGFVAKVYRDFAWVEYQVTLSHHGVKIEGAEAHTNDKADALATADAMVSDAIKAELAAVEIDGIEYDREAREVVDIRVKPSVHGEYRGGYPWIHPEMAGVHFAAEEFNKGELIEGLVCKGYNLLGAGSYCSVFKLPGRDRVVKVSEGSGDPWIYYAAAAIANSHNSLMPRISSLVIFEGGNYVAVIERLNEIDDSPYDVFPEYLAVSDFLIQGDTPRIKLPGEWAEWVSLLKRVLEVAKDANGQGLAPEIDMHVGNIMCRDDGSPVITDPIACYGVVSRNHLESLLTKGNTNS